LPPANRNLTASTAKAGVTGKRARFGWVMLQGCLVRAGGKVVIVDIDATAGEAQAAELGANARFAKTDVTDEASATAAIEMAVNEFGGLHGLVNCAGVAPPRKCSAAMARTIWPPLRAW
jgi:NAD(P)-dependent dehydrogenase (short-subunit alcohol dehydrogenase family)